MPWQTPHPHAVTVDEGPSLIGSTWKRRVAQGDDWDGPVAIVGVWDNGPDFGLEFVVQTVAFTGQPTLTSDADSFVAAYEPDEPDPFAALRDRVSDLERLARS